MLRDEIAKLYVGTKLFDTITGDKIFYIGYKDNYVIGTDENDLTVWLPYDRVRTKE